MKKITWKLNSDDDLPLNKSLQFHDMTIIIRSVLEKDGKLYLQVFFRWYFVWIKYMKMLEYNKIDISVEIDVNKTNLSKECDICHYWYFKNIGLRYMSHIFAMVFMI